IVFTKERFRFFRKANPNNRLSVDALLSTGFKFADDDLDTGIRATINWYQSTAGSFDDRPARRRAPGQPWYSGYGVGAAPPN
ncbi:MAG TPA: hypothetical protein VHU17_00030, partial [Acidimicrobiales bacterium]|nr:hypothetical protein [Acidimicrobiales bacterium]